MVTTGWKSSLSRTYYQPTRGPAHLIGGEEIDMTNDRTASLVFLCAGIYGFIYSVQLPMGRWNEPGPGVFPFTLSLLLLISGVAWFIRGKGGEAEKGEREKAVGLAFIRNLGTPLKIVGLTALFVLAFSRAGYLITSTLYLFILLLWVSRYKIIVSAALAVGIGVGSWYFFAKILAVPLPQGPLPF
jgi:putative tricarboxylic transport membrane protein